MRRPALLLVLPLLLAAGCAPNGAEPADGPSSGSHHAEAFDQRATEVAEAWRPGTDWRTGYVPLEGPTLLTGDPRFTPETEAAFRAGWYRAQVPIPPTRVGDEIRFPDGRLTLPLVSAAEAYRQLDQGDPLPCPGRPKRPGLPTPGGPTVEPGPDGWATSTSQTACLSLTVTGVTYGTVPVRTSRGEAQVPAWLFTIEELATPVVRLAVAATAITAVPEATAPARALPDGLVAAQDLTAVDGARLTVRLGVGACDTGITPLVRERPDVVVVGGSVTRATGLCPAVLKLEPVTVTLAAPLGARPVLDVFTGAPLTIAPR
ncbi:hypothetical protein [Micromonospora parathelypteridis]|uniref:Lipoprotein n=1 Tax=Micromonospora parathelypteridis TaxID=1839617 RepID=A0A840VQ55_9ACTN|nr:hypothetical protein [Micromonospora parathelypteridis]MBB5479253.1 hypothetical protein [Micromonospora parathelypteridis]GGO02226.1 hypothetical protein GCM10011576_01460 [Micromonospora parathelypteridis]